MINTKPISRPVTAGAQNYAMRPEIVSEAEIEVLMWSDIVKNSMSSGIFFTYLNMLKTAWIYISSGTLFDIVKLRKDPVIAALYPIGF